jgi:hypothetical protein
VTPNVLALLPARARQILYVLYGLVALAVATTAVGYNALNLDNPPWLVVAGAVVAFLAVPFSALASLNVTAHPPGEEPELEARPVSKVIPNNPSEEENAPDWD